MPGGFAEFVAVPRADRNVCLMPPKADGRGDWKRTWHEQELIIYKVSIYIVLVMIVYIIRDSDRVRVYEMGGRSSGVIPTSSSAGLQNDDCISRREGLESHAIAKCARGHAAGPAAAGRDVGSLWLWWPRAFRCAWLPFKIILAFCIILDSE